MALYVQKLFEESHCKSGSNDRLFTSFTSAYDRFQAGVYDRDDLLGVPQLSGRLGTRTLITLGCKNPCATKHRHTFRIRHATLEHQVDIGRCIVTGRGSTTRTVPSQ